MIDLATTLLTPAPALPSAPRAALSTASDFALAFAQLSGSASAITPVIAAPGSASVGPEASVLVAVVPLPSVETIPLPATLTQSGPRQPLAAPGTSLPEAAPDLGAAVVAFDLPPTMTVAPASPLPIALPIAAQKSVEPATTAGDEALRSPSEVSFSPDEIAPKRSKATAAACPDLLPAFELNVPLSAPPPKSVGDDAVIDKPAPLETDTERSTDVVAAAPLPVPIEVAPTPAAPAREPVTSPIVPAVAPPAVADLGDATMREAPIAHDRTPAPQPNVPAVTSLPSNLDGLAREVPVDAHATLPAIAKPPILAPALAPALTVAQATSEPIRRAVRRGDDALSTRAPDERPSVLAGAPSAVTPPVAPQEPTAPAGPHAPATVDRAVGPRTEPAVASAAPVAPVVAAPSPVIAASPIIATADRVARAAMQPLPMDTPAPPGFDRQPASAPVTPIRRASVVAASVRPAEQPAAQAFAAQLFAATTQKPRDETDPLAELSAAFPLAGLSGAAPTIEQVTAPTAAQDLPLDLTDDGWMTGMIDRIETLRDSAGVNSEARIRLSPDALGAIDVAITRDDAGTLQVQLSTETPQARAVLAEAAPRLADMAEARGLKLGGAAVDAGAGQPGGERRESHQSAPAPRRPVSAAADTHPQSDHRIA